MKNIYLDYGATTPVKPEVLDKMIPFFTDNFGNPSSLYNIGQHSKAAIEEARSNISKLINCNSNELYFTASGTEADNWALIGTADALKQKGNHIITTKVEHHAILHTCEHLEKHGYRVTYLDINADGIIDLNQLREAICDETILISIMLVNNEIGTVQPIKEISSIAKEKGILVHTDAVQGLGNVNIDVEDMGVDLLSLSAHKIYGPKGIGALYIKRGTKLTNFVFGGAQEMKKRAGTENLPGIVGFGEAARLAGENFQNHVKHVSTLRDYLVKEIKEKIPHIYINGSMERRHPGNANITFDFIEGEAILLFLNAKGISVSTGSACSSRSLEPSHVLSALGVPYEKIHGTIRFSIGDMTTKEDIDYVVKELVDIIEKLRMMSPINSEKGWK